MKIHLRNPHKSKQLYVNVMMLLLIALNSQQYQAVNQDDEAPPPPEYVVLDCSFVSGLDGNAVDGFLKLQVSPPC